jgi:dTDP-4-dehydrorhamnose 3,5-epimerase
MALYALETPEVEAMGPRLQVRPSGLDGVLLIEPPTVFEDFRGAYVETWNRRLYSEAGIRLDFVQDDISVSSRHVLRGIHGDEKTWKLISCLHGSFYLVVVNYDPQSPQYRQWESFTLSDRNRLQVLVPPRFGNGHLVLSDSAIFHYKQTTEYDRPSQFTLPWNDPELGIWWPVREPIVSRRDQGL